MKRISNILIMMSCLFVSVFLGVASLNAKEILDENGDIIRDGDVVTAFLNTNDDQYVQTIVSKYLADPTINNVKVINKEYKENIQGNPNSISSLGYRITLGPCPIPATQTVTPNLIVKTGGDGGGTITMTDTRTVTNSITKPFGVTNSMISDAVGFDVTESSSYSISYTYKVPNNVSHMYISAYPICNIQPYNVYDYFTLKGKGTAYRVIGIDYVKSY